MIPSSHVRFVQVVLGALICGLAWAQGGDSRLGELRLQYRLVKPAFFGGDAAAQGGTQMVVQKPGIFGVGSKGAMNPAATYEGGVLHPPVKTAALFSGNNSYWFQVGEPVYPMKFEIEEKTDRIQITVVNARLTYKGVVRFQFPKGFLASAQTAQVQKVIDEVLPIGDAAIYAAQGIPRVAPTAGAVAPQTQPAFDLGPADSYDAARAPASVAQGDAPYQIFASSHMGVAYYMAVTDFIILFPNGYALGALPPQGMDGFSMQAYMQQMGRTPNAIARYQMFQDHLEMAYSNFSRAYALPEAGGAESLVPLCICNRTTFGGVFSYGNLMVQFNPDGSFVDRGALDNVVWKNFGAPRLSQGRYVLRFNTLYVQTADGRQGRISFAAPAAQEGSGSFDWIALDQKMARRVQ